MGETLNISSTLEDCLKEIYIITGVNQLVRVTDLALLLNVSKPSINKSIRRLKELGLLDQEHYGKVQLTLQGNHIAKELLKKNKLLYRFLMEHMGMTHQEAVDDADRLEHCVSDALMKRIMEISR